MHLVGLLLPPSQKWYKFLMCLLVIGRLNLKLYSHCLIGWYLILTSLVQVSSVAKDLIEKGLREMELDFSSHLETTYQEMFEKETKKKIFTNVPVNWELPDGIKLAQDDIFSQIIAV